LPSFPRKALEAELDLYVNGEMGKVSLFKDTRILGGILSPYPLLISMLWCNTLFYQYKAGIRFYLSFKCLKFV
jgi:hypothetical protein